MLEISFARFRASMATSNVERTPPRPFCRWEFATIVEDGVVARKRLGKGSAGENLTLMQVGGHVPDMHHDGPRGGEEKRARRSLADGSRSSVIILE